MWDAQIAAVAGQQFNRISRSQLSEIGVSPKGIVRRVESGRLVITNEGVFAIAPVLEDDRGDWMGATLTAPGSRLSLAWAGHAWGFWYRPGGPIRITRPGSGGPRRLSGVIAHRSTTVEWESTELDGIPITTVPRTLLDLARYSRTLALARGVREAIRLDLTTCVDLTDFVLERRRRKGAHALLRVLARYAGLPLERARSGAEVKALELLRDAGRPLPRLNVRVAGEEADLSWPSRRLIVEIDGGPYHRDRGEDARKTEVWVRAGWEVRRIPSDDVYEMPAALLAICA